MELVEKTWDAVVVGAGPAGCAAAYDLATAGCSVLLLDKKDFPRAKACAGGLTVKAVEALRYSIAPVVRETIQRVRLAGSGDDLVVKNRTPICVMTVRAELDEYCLRKTLVAGAAFERIPSIQQVRCSGDRVEVFAGDRCYQAKYLVGADGASGQMRLLCGQDGWYAQGFALEVRAENPKKPADLTFDFASVPHGYAWIFPKQDHVNVGVYSCRPAHSLTRAGLLAYMRDSLQMEASEGVVGQYLGLGADAAGEVVRTEFRDRVFLVGDAGGFVDPLTGEGIYGALVSGQAAAAAIVAAQHGKASASETFAARLEDYRQILRFSKRAATAFYNNPARGFRAMRVPLLRSAVLRTYARGVNTKSLAFRLALAKC